MDVSYRNRIIGGALASLATFGLGATLQGARAASSGNVAQPMAWHHQGGRTFGDGVEGGMMQVLRGLNLSDPQKQQIHTLVSTARIQWRSQSESALNDLPALGNPGDPNHATAIVSAQARAAQRIQTWSALEQQIYSVLTPAQQAQLPQLLTQLQSRMAARHSARKSAARAPNAP
jgi:Spy/CpxP family protein refolding chaperone